MNDREADEFGPITELALEKERQRSRLDPSHPRRQLRLIPVGQNDKGTPESKAFQSIRFGKRYANQSSSQSKTGKAKQTGNDMSTSAREDVSRIHRTFCNVKVQAAQIQKHVLKLSMIICEVHNASAHFVNTTDLAKKVGTVNIHALLSH